MLGSLHTINEETMIKSDQYPSPEVAPDRRQKLLQNNLSKSAFTRDSVTMSQ